MKIAQWSKMQPAIPPKNCASAQATVSWMPPCKTAYLVSFSTVHLISNLLKNYFAFKIVAFGAGSSCVEDVQCSSALLNGGVCKSDGKCGCAEGMHYVRGRCWPSTRNFHQKHQSVKYTSRNHLFNSCRRKLQLWRRMFSNFGSQRCKVHWKQMHLRRGILHERIFRLQEKGWKYFYLFFYDI